MNGQLGNSEDPRAQSASLAMPEVEGFTLFGFLGSGPSGQTWHAQTQAGRTVALKLLSPRLTSQPGFLARFEKETAPLLALHHPHIADLVERGSKGNQFYIATEYLPGNLLQKSLPEPLDTPATLRLALEVSQALHHAHQRGLQHHGLTPTNILLNAWGVAKVVDFGLARLRDDVPSSPNPYAAPEQRTRNIFPDERADLYALATVLYERLYRERPPRPWSAAASKVPVRETRLFSLFSKSLADDPDQRFRKVRDFADELERALDTNRAAPVAPAVTVTQASGPLSLEVKGRTISVKVRGRGDVEWLKRSLLALDQLLRQPGPWGVAYDLSEMAGWSTREIEVVADLHRRHEKNLRRVGFCSPSSAVRGGGVLVGTAVREVPWNTFASVHAMQDWVEGGSPE